MFPHFLSFIKENVSTEDKVMTGSITLKVFLLKCQGHASNLTYQLRGKFFHSNQ